jgi:hypothetical protein
MEIVTILGVDPSLRNTGLAVVEYNTDFSVHDPAGFKIRNCQTIINPPKYANTDAILNMIDLINEESKKECYLNVDNVMIESPPAMFNKNWCAGTVASIAHISGACVALLGVDKSYLFRPNEWNKSRKKDITHAETVAFFGSIDDWHFEKVIKNEKHLEHVLDAASLALWWIRANYNQE